MVGEFPGSPVVRVPCFHCWDPSSVPGWGTEILKAMQHAPPQNIYIYIYIYIYRERERERERKGSWAR